MTWYYDADRPMTAIFRYHILKDDVSLTLCGIKLKSPDSEVEIDDDEICLKCRKIYEKAGGEIKWA